MNLLLYLPSKMRDSFKLSKNGYSYYGEYCYFCDNSSKVGKLVCYTPSKKILKCFCCGVSFKEYTKIIEFVNYMNWLENNACFNYKRSINELELVDNLPF